VFLKFPIRGWLPILGATALALAGCRPGAGSRDTDPPDGLRVLRISQRNEPADLDPAIAALPDEFFIIRALSEGLVLPATEGGPPTAGAADLWETSPDGLTWTFHLREGARWSDGEPVTADDFIASFRRVLSPGTAASHPELFYPVHNARAFYEGGLADFAQVGLSAPDSSTVIVRLDAPNPLFLNYVASGPWIPVNPRAVAHHGRQWTLPGAYVGNGPYTLSVWKPNQRIVVVKNPMYYAASRIQLDQIQFIRLDDGDAEDRSYRAGQIDVTMAVPFSKLGAYARERPAELHRGPLAETRCLVFNTQRAVLDDPRVRAALALAIDRARLCEDVLLGGQQPAYRLLPEALRPAGDAAPRLGRDESEESPLAAVAEARSRLAEAGYPGGRNFPRLELTGWSAGNPALEVIQAMWKRNLGIDVTIANRDARAHLAALQAGHYDIAFVAVIPSVPDPLAVLQQFLSDSPDNYPRWSDNLYDGLVRAAALADETRRNELLLAAETRLLTFVPITPIYFNERNWLMKPSVRGWMEDEMWTRFYPSLWLDAGAR
jgi:oligopeptide transport system substrate-binding protein